MNPKAQAPRCRSRGLSICRATRKQLDGLPRATGSGDEALLVWEADETFDAGFGDDDQFAETDGFYDIKGSDDESSEGEKKKKKKKDKKKKEETLIKVRNPDHEDPFYIGGGHVRPGIVPWTTCPSRAPVEEGTFQG